MLSVLVSSILAIATPDVQFDRSTNTITVQNAEVASIVGPDALLVQGYPLIDSRIVVTTFTEGIASWTLGPGDYIVRAWGEPGATGVREPVELSYTVQEPDRAARIRDAVTRMFAAMNAWRDAQQEIQDLQPTDAEIFSAFRGD